MYVGGLAIRCIPRGSEGRSRRLREDLDLEIPDEPSVLCAPHALVMPRTFLVSGTLSIQLSGFPRSWDP